MTVSEIADQWSTVCQIHYVLIILFMTKFGGFDLLALPMHVS